MRLDIPDEKILVHEMVLSIAWGDMDALGHVNNTVYFRYMESVRVAWMHAQGSGPGPDQGPVIVNTFCNFYRPLVWPGEVRARLYVANPGRSSFETYVTLSRADDPEVLCAAGGATVVWVDRSDQRSTALPQALRLRLGFTQT